MKRWSVRHVFVLLLAVFVTAGIGSSFVQASGMAAKMTVASDMGASIHDGCKACPPSSDGRGKAMTCISGCIAPVLAVLPQAKAMVVAEAPTFFSVFPPLLRGIEPPPNFSPPRSTDIA